jgi:hypothetical protein
MEIIRWLAAIIFKVTPTHGKNLDITVTPTGWILLAGLLFCRAFALWWIFSKIR